jgi:anti-anti-sigma regulatory factor
VEQTLQTRLDDALAQALQEAAEREAANSDMD